MQNITCEIVMEAKGERLRLTIIRFLGDTFTIIRAKVDNVVIRSLGLFRDPIYN